MREDDHADAYEIDTIDLDKFRKIIYQSDAELQSILPLFILGVAICSFLLMVGFLLEDVKELCIPLGVAALVGFSIAGIIKWKKTTVVRFTNERSTPVQSRKEREKIKKHGVMYVGIITGLNVIGSTTHHFLEAVNFLRRGQTVDQTVLHFAYTVKYEDAYHNEKEFETDRVSNYSEKHIGQRCTVYEYEGKVIADAIEEIEKSRWKLIVGISVTCIGIALIIGAVIALIITGGRYISEGPVEGSNSSLIIGIVAITGVIALCVGFGLVHNYKNDTIY